MIEQKPLVIDHQIFVSCQFVLRELIEQLYQSPQDVEGAMMYIAAMEVAKQKLIEKFSL
jgi:hypothetical protein